MVDPMPADLPRLDPVSAWQPALRLVLDDVRAAVSHVDQRGFIGGLRPAAEPTAAGVTEAGAGRIRRATIRAAHRPRPLLLVAHRPLFPLTHRHARAS